MRTRYSIALMLATACLCVGSGLSPFAAMDPSEEVYHYKEATGNSVKAVAWRLNKGKNFVITYSSQIERHVTTTDPTYDTRSWQVTAENGQTNFSAERIGQTILVRGTFKGTPIDKLLEIDESPWYQATSLSLRQLVTSRRF